MACPPHLRPFIKWHMSVPTTPAMAVRATVALRAFGLKCVVSWHPLEPRALIVYHDEDSVPELTRMAELFANGWKPTAL